MILLYRDRSLQKVQIYDDASQNRLKHKTTTLVRRYFPRPSGGFFFYFLRFSFEMAGDYDPSHWETSDRNKKEQKVRDLMPERASGFDAGMLLHFLFVLAFFFLFFYNNT